MNQDQIMQLLVLAEQPSLADQLLGSLRDDDHGIRSRAVQQEAELIDSLREKLWDLIVCFEGPGTPSASRVLELLRQLQLDTPLVAVLEAGAATSPQDLLARGARDVLTLPERERLALSVTREVERQRLAKSNRRLRLNLQELEKRHHLLLQGASDAVSYVHEGTHLYCNPSYAAFFDYPDTESITTIPLLDLVGEADRPALRQVLGGPLPAQRRLSAQARRADGSEFAMAMLFSPLQYNGEPCLQLTVEPASGNTDYARQLEDIESRDLLTQLENPAHFQRSLEEAIGAAVREEVRSALLLLRLEHFGAAEKTLGRARANLLLAEVGKFLQQSIGLPFQAGRLDQHEFAVLLHEEDPEAVLEAAGLLRDKFNEDLAGAAGLPALHLGCTVGVAAINGHTLSAADLIARARSNPLTRTGEASNYQFRLEDSLTPGMGEIAAYLEKALEEERFKLLFQPVVNLKGSGRRGYEVLCRMLDSDGNEVLPGAFLPAAEMHGLGEKLDRLVLTRVLRLLKQSDSPSASLLINLCQNTLVGKTFLPWLSQQLREWRAPTELLAFEISEVDLCRSPEALTAFCDGLEELNLKKVLSHFGCASEPFKYLEKARPQYVTLDETLLRNLAYSQQQRDNLRTMVRDLHRLGCAVAAPRVEDMEVLPALWDIGVDLVQGYCLQAPSQHMDYEFIQEEEITLSAAQPL